MNKKISFYFLVSILVLRVADGLFAQTLVLNGSFEKFYKCPNNFTETKTTKFLPNWEMPTKGTPDYFNICSKEMVGVPQNFMGNIHAFEGVGYIGLVLMDTPKDVRKEINYREYIQTRFAVSLQRDELYLIKFYYSVAAYSTYGINRLGIYFSHTKITQKKGVFNFKPQINIDTSAIYCNPGEWIQFCDTFRAYGDENFMTIGNFYKDSKTKYIINDISMYPNTIQEKVNTNQVAYYYIDNVSVEKIDKKDFKNDYDFIQKFRPFSHYNNQDLLDSVGSEISYLLDDVYFNTIDNNLPPVSFFQIDNLANLLIENPEINITLIGLLQNLEKETRGATLRTNVFLKLLIDRGISANRIITKTENIKIFPRTIKFYIQGKSTELNSNLIAIMISKNKR